MVGEQAESCPGYEVVCEHTRGNCHPGRKGSSRQQQQGCLRGPRRCCYCCEQYRLIFFIDTRYITLLKKLKLFLFPGLRRVRSPSRVLLLYTIFGRMPGFEPELLRPQPGCGTQNTHPLKKNLNQTPTPAKISCL